MDTVDVIIPCYNYGRYLAACTASVLSQTGCQTRVLIIDDASTDGSQAMGERLAAARSEITFVAHPQNRGHIATYNEGIDWTRSPYLLLLSADDLLAPGALARSVALLSANPRASFAYGEALRFTGDAMPPDGDEAGADDSGNDETGTGKTATGERATDGAARHATVRPGRDFIHALCDDPTNPVETATAVVRTAVQKQVGGYRPDLPHAGDFEMWLRLAAHGDVGFIPARQAFTRMHSNNMRIGYLADRMLGDFRQRHAAFRSFFDSERGAVADADGLETLANRRLARDVIWAAAHAFEEGAPADVAKLRELAAAIWPPIRRSAQWRKLSVKQLLGRRGWLATEAALRHLRPGAKRSPPAAA